MLFCNIDFAVVYIDPSIASGGDGSTPSQALKNLPGASELADRTCYIIRRTAEGASCTLPSGTNSSLEHLLLMGMPLPTDTAYELVPDEAKASWAADTAPYARISTSNTSATLNMANLRTFLMNRIHFFRTCTSTSQYLVQSYQTGEYKGTFAVEHCKFGVQGVEPGSDAWAGPAYENYAMYRYLYFGYLRYLRIKDCDIDFRPYSSDYSAIYCQYPEILDVEDTRVNLLPYSSSRGSFALNFRNNYEQQGIEATVTNLSFRYVANGSENRYFAGGIRLGYHLSTRISGVTATSVIPQGMATPTDEYTPYQSLVCFESLQDFRIRGITANLPHFWRLSSRLLQFTGSAYSYSPGIERELSDVSVTLGDSSDTAIGRHWTYDEYRNTDDYNYYAFNVSFGSSSSSYYIKACKADNIVVNAPRCKAAYFEHCRLTNSSFSGMVNLQRTMADITSISTWFPGCALRMGSGSHARIGALTVNRENATYPYNYDSAVERDRGNCSCFIEEANAIPEQTSLSGSGVGQQYAISCASECENGHYTLRTQNIAVDTWNVRRVGGASAALKLWNDKWNNTGMVVLGRKPFKGKLLTAATPGRYILKCHVAWKNYANIGEMNRRLLVTATTDEGGSPRVWCSSVNGRWADDSVSVWENDSDLVQKVLEMPIDVEEAGIVDVRLYFSWYSADGFLYVDPAFTLELQDRDEEEDGEEEQE